MPQTETLAYLKNVFMKFLEQHGERDQLVPVLAALLHLDADEAARLKSATATLHALPLPSLADAATSYWSRWTR